MKQRNGFVQIKIQEKRTPKESPKHQNFIEPVHGR